VLLPYPTPLGLDYDSKGVISFDPTNSTLNPVPIASNWPQITSNPLFLCFETVHLCSRCFGSAKGQEPRAALGLLKAKSQGAKSLSYTTFSSPRIQWRNRTMSLPISCGTAALGCVFERQSVVQTRRAKALSGFRFAPPLHEKKEIPGETPGVESFGFVSGPGLQPGRTSDERTPSTLPKARAQCSGARCSRIRIALQTSQGYDIGSTPCENAQPWCF
jgi:hypothetical protein